MITITRLLNIHYQCCFFFFFFNFDAVRNLFYVEIYLCVLQYFIALLIMAESEEELKSLLMKVKEESEKLA